MIASAPSDLLPFALRYRAAGLAPIPCHAREKRPLVEWQRFQTTPPSEAETREHFGKGGAAIGLVCGKVSGGLELLDFDCSGEAFEAWKELVEGAAPGLTAETVIERSQRGGIHVVFRCLEVETPGNAKLAQRDDGSGKPKCLIETRGSGGQFICAPSPGYELLQGDLEHVPEISREARALFIEAAQALNTWTDPKRTVDGPSKPRASGEGIRPGEDFNARGDVAALLEKHGWTRAGTKGENGLWRRPGKTSGWSATLHPDKGFYNFSANAAPFDPGVSYSAFAVAAMLEHGGDYGRAALALAKEGFGTPEPEYKAAAEAKQGADDPPIRSFKDLLDRPPPTPPELVKGFLFKGSKASLSSTSKGFKTWFQLHLGACVATGTPWLGYEVVQGRVLYLNLELAEWSLAKRIASIMRTIDANAPSNGFEYVQMRGERMTLERLVKFAERRIAKGGYDLLIVDPLYKLLGGRDENAAGDMAEMLLALEAIAHDAGAALLIAHHYAKGNAGAKFAIDRASGSGVLARDGDAILTLTPHEIEGCVTFEAILRDLPAPAPVGLRWNHPIFELAPEITPGKHAQPGRKKTWTAEDVLTVCKDFMTKPELIAALEAHKGMSSTTARRCIKEALGQGLLLQSGESYSIAPDDETGDLPK